MFLLVKWYKPEVYEKCQNIHIRSFIVIMMNNLKKIPGYYKKGEIIKVYYLLIDYKGEHLYTEKCYKTLEIDYIFHTSPETICWTCKSIT